MSYNTRSDYLYGEGKNGVVVRSIQPIDDEKQQLQRPVMLQPSWEENNLPEDELNFKNLTMEDASLQLHTPPDRYKLVYLTFLIHGIGVLMPWNMFITAESYFTKYKFSKDYIGQDLGYAASFLQYLTFASQVPNILFNYINIFVHLGGNLTTRIVWSISIEVVIFILTIILAMTNTSEWPGLFFWVTMVSVVVLNIANGIYQNTVFGMAAKLPVKYTGAVVLGSNISGTFTSVVSILSQAFSSNKRMAAIYYFITALFILLVCFDTYFALPLNKFFKHYELKEKKDAQLRLQNNQGRSVRIPYFYVFKKALPQLFNVFLVFFVTLSVFPTVMSNIQKSDENFIIPNEYYTSVTCFLTFNVFAMLGSSLPTFFTWPGPKYLWIPISLRILYIPFFLLCKYEVINVSRTLPVLIENDWVYWITAVTLGLTSGYFSSLGMMYTSKIVEPQYATTAGMFAAAALITGIFTGILATFMWPWIISHIGY